MQNASEFNVQAAKQELFEFDQFLPSLNFEAVKQGGYNDALNYYFQLASKLAICRAKSVSSC
jgi:hypothetical protein